VWRFRELELRCRIDELGKCQATDQIDQIGCLRWWYASDISWKVDKVRAIRLCSGRGSMTADSADNLG
jgi:hypothetical protein